ncbi:uncharacterized protein An09g04480 [Aspergillus niger]|uniref:Contig An09c0110, genomic contig n=2 Tax=Aspergillus niger TaxID=5061 RepID=A2QU59_ASPNC|nr:uncharacterized protein An09g04480 [Aspergillus niger]CAK40302.1 unnamed protein product [Aspergillus niger]
MMGVLLVYILVAYLINYLEQESPFLYGVLISAYSPHTDSQDIYDLTPDMTDLKQGVRIPKKGEYRSLVQSRSVNSVSWGTENIGIHISTIYMCICDLGVLVGIIRQCNTMELYESPRNYFLSLINVAWEVLVA